MRRHGTALMLVSVLVATAGTPTTPLARADDAAPRFVITPERVLHDREVSIQLHGLKPGQRVTVRATRGAYKSEMEFAVDAAGKVDASKSDPKLGGKASPLQLLWSMKRDETVKDVAAPMDELAPIKVSLSALVDGKQVAVGSFEFIFLSPDVERITVKEGRLRGVLFRPKAGGNYPGLITLSGAGGGLSESRAALRAAHGYAVLALAYFNYDDLPKNLVAIPVEYFEEALAWMEKQPFIDGERLAFLGASRGGELALLLGAHFPGIKAVIAYAPSHVVGRAAGGGREAAWTYRGEPIPWFTPKVDEAEYRKLLEANPGNTTPAWRFRLRDEAAVRKAAIPVEKSEGAVLLITGADDRVWSSSDMADAVVKRMQDHKCPNGARHLKYPDAGHFIGLPNEPTTDTTLRGTLTKASLGVGGTAQGGAYASWDSWSRGLEFLEKHLKQK